MKTLSILLLTAIPSIAFSQSISKDHLQKVERAWERVDPFGAGDRFSVSVDDCMIYFRWSPKVSCEDGGTLSGSEQTINLREVSEIQGLLQSKRPHFRFLYRVPGPNRLETIMNHLTKPREEALQEYAEASESLLEGAKLTSGKRLISCDGSETTQRKRHALVFVTELPEHWSTFMLLASQCGVSSFE